MPRAAERRTRPTALDERESVVHVSHVSCDRACRRVFTPPLPSTGVDDVQGHVFISYVREDAEAVDRLERFLTRGGAPVWRDVEALWPGDEWKLRISKAINDNSLVFLGCFSTTSVAKEKTYQREEILLAVDQVRLRPPGAGWFIPVRFDDVELPYYDLGAGRTLDSLHRVDLFGDDWEGEAARLLSTVLRLLGKGTSQSPALVEGGRAAAESMKRELGETSVIAAHDRLRRELERVRSSDVLRVDGAESGSDQPAVVDRITIEIEVLTALIATVAYWGNESSDRWWLPEIPRFAQRPLLNGLVSVLDRPRTPGLVIAMAAGTAAVASGRDDLLRSLFTLPLVRDPTQGKELPPVLILAPGLLHVSDALERIYRLLRGPFVEYLGLGVEAFAEAWERWQYLVLLSAWHVRDLIGAYVEMSDRAIRVDGHRPKRPAAEDWLRREVARLARDHPLLAPGWFDADPTNLVRALTELSSALSENAERADWQLLGRGSGMLPSGLHYPGHYTSDAETRFGRQ